MPVIVARGLGRRGRWSCAAARRIGASRPRAARGRARDLVRGVRLARSRPRRRSALRARSATGTRSAPCSSCRVRSRGSSAGFALQPPGAYGSSRSSRPRCSAPSRFARAQRPPPGLALVAGRRRSRCSARGARRSAVASAGSATRAVLVGTSGWELRYEPGAPLTGVAARIADAGITERRLALWHDALDDRAATSPRGSATARSGSDESHGARRSRHDLRAQRVPGARRPSWGGRASPLMVLLVAWALRPAGGRHATPDVVTALSQPWRWRGRDPRMRRLRVALPGRAPVAPPRSSGPASSPAGQGATDEGGTRPAESHEARDAAVRPVVASAPRRRGDPAVPPGRSGGGRDRAAGLGARARARASRLARAAAGRLDDVLDHGGGGVVVTFDDGTPDFHELVVPLLERYRVPGHAVPRHPAGRDRSGGHLGPALGGRGHRARERRVAYA